MISSFISDGTTYSLYSDFRILEKSVSGVGNYPVYNEFGNAASKAGADYKGTRGLERIITISGVIACADFEEELSLLNSLIFLWFRKQISLILDNERQIDVYYIGGLEGRLSLQSNGIPFSAKFIAVNPYFYLPPLQTNTIPNTPSSVVLTNGTAPCFPIIHISGNGGAIESISNLTNGKDIIFDEMMDLLWGETITIDLTPGRKTILSSCRGNMFPRVDTSSNVSSFVLVPGNNTLQSNISGATVTIDWYPCYAGGN